MTAQAAASVTSFASPTALAEAISLKESLGDTAVYVAGGTDLGVQLRRRIIEPAHLIALNSIAELGGIGTVGNEVQIGGTVCHREIEESDLCAGELPALAEACRTVGSVQTRNIGTLGGNLANASPAADTPPVLLAFGAVVDLQGPGGERSVPIDEFFEGYRQTALRGAELIRRVRIPLGRPGTGSAFIKLGRRKAMEISIACVGVRLDLAGDGTVESVGIGLGSVAPTVVRAGEAEALLMGAIPTDDVISLAATAAVGACHPIDDVRASAAYRLAMVPILVARALQTALQRTGA